MGNYTEAQRLRYRLDCRLKKAIRDYGLLSEGDRLLVGLSGGKDSLALVELLGDLSRRFRPRFQVEALHVIMANIPYRADLDYLRAHCQAHGVGFRVAETSFNPETDRRKSPCFLCSWNRRKLLFETAKSLGCNKIALGHHRDDFLETLLLNMFFQGSIQAMKPRMPMDRFPMEIIRPLCLVSEQELTAFARLQAYPPQLKDCPYEQSSHRPDVRRLLDEAEARFPGAKDSLWGAMHNVCPDYLPEKIPDNQKSPGRTDNAGQLAGRPGQSTGSATGKG